MPAKTARQRRFAGAELRRKREGKRTRSGMTEAQLEELARKPKGNPHPVSSARIVRKVKVVRGG